MKLKILGQPHDEVLLITDSRYKNYKANEDRIILKDSLLFRKYFRETGSVKYCQMLITKQLVKGVLRSLHGEFGTAFMSHVIKELAGVLGIALKHATAKNAQTIGLLEQSHESIKQALKLRQASGDHCGTSTSILLS